MKRSLKYNVNAIGNFCDYLLTISFGNAFYFEIFSRVKLFLCFYTVLNN